jgi:hypothetical protein
MPPRPAPSRIAQALEYLQGLKGRAGEMLNTVASTPGTLRPDEYQERFGLPGDPVPAPREVGQKVREAVTRFTSLDAPQNPTFAEMAADTGASFVPGVGQLLAARDIERARRADDPAGMAMAASNFLPVDRLIGALRHGLGKPPISELDVYHGTPHKYAPTEANPLGEFDASKIGTGEGAQAFGHGIYLAQKPEVAQDYQFMLSKIDPETVTYQGKPAQHWYDTAQAEQDRAHRLRDKAAIDRANAKLAYWENVMTRRHPEDVKRVANDPDDGWKTFADYANSLDMNKFGGVGEAGSLYKADLPDQMIDRMLDWDKPLSEQHPEVQRIIGEEIKRIGGSAHTGERAYRELMFEARMQGKKSGSSVMKNNLEANEASKRLQELGIPGIKYADAGSRGQGGSGTRNFVVFPGEEKKVRILERNGQPAPERIAQALEAVSQGGKVVGIRSRQTAKMADRINETLGGGPQSLSDNVQREMKLATSVLQSKNPQAVEDWVQAYYNADLPMEQFEAATTNLRKTLSPETVDALIQNAGAFGTADQFKAFLNATPTERAKQLAKVSK